MSGHHHHSHAPIDLPQGSETARLMRRATLAAVAIASLLIVAKLIVWWRSDSLAILSSLTDSFFDLLTSVINLIAVRYALKPADDDHRFGHTSIEDIAGLAQGAFISASMLLIILQSLERLFNPEPIAHEQLGMAVSMFGMIATSLLVAYQTYVARRTRSLIVLADRLHYAGDIAFNLGVLLALAASLYLGWSWADPLVALLIASAVLWSSRSIGLRAYHNLMDREMPETEKEKIYAVLRNDVDLHGYHNLKTRFAGTKPFIQFHAEIAAGLSFRDAHAIIDRIEQRLQEMFPGADVIIHPDPIEPRVPQAYDA